MAPELPEGYSYPPPLQGNPNYRAPIRYLDLEALDGQVALAPNFTLKEIAKAWKGRYAVVQPHAIARLQQLRDLLGPIAVHSGYRPPGYNADIGGAANSRHMYGDAFDLDPVDATLEQLEQACSGNGGFLVEYETHVHCDWRSEAVDLEFFGPADGAAPVKPPSRLAARLEHDGGALWLAPARGFDEGEPLRRWTARDRSGRVMAQARGRSFAPPVGASTIEVLVGAQVRLRAELE